MKSTWIRMDGPWIGDRLFKGNYTDETQGGRDMIKAKRNEDSDNFVVVMIAAQHCAAFGV